jgi:hypothetical protein
MHHYQKNRLFDFSGEMVASTDDSRRTQTEYLDDVKHEDIEMK